MIESGLTKNKILSELAKSPHGKLSEYVPIGTQATRQEPEFMAHLIAWNRVKGSIRDSQVSLPIVSLAVPEFPAEFVDNSLAHLALLGPRELLKALRFVLELKLPGRMRVIRRLVEGYLHEKEVNFPQWDRMAIQHRGTLRELYALAHAKPANERVNIVLYGRTFDKRKMPPPYGSIFEVVSKLKDMSSVEAAGAVIKWKIPFLIAMGALGKKAQEPDLVLALIDRMSPTELITNVKMLEKLGVKTNPALRGAFEKAMEKASKSKANVLKTTVAAEAVEDEGLKEKLRGMQERQIQALGGIEGSWLVLADRSGSMAQTLEIARQVAGTLAKMVKNGKVWLVFFDTSPQTIDVTGLPLDVIKKATEHIRAGGGTSIGCGLQRMLDEGQEVDGIAVISDAQENNVPYFADVYTRYSEKFGKTVPVYLYRTKTTSPYYADIDFADSMKRHGHDLQEFDMKGVVDYYSLPNLVNTMRVSRYSLVDEIMATKLLRLSDVLKIKGREVKANVA